MNVFKRGTLEIVAGKYTDKVVLVIVTVFGFWVSIESSKIDLHRFVKFLSVGIPLVFVPIWFLFSILCWRFAYKVQFDEESGEVTFYMYRRKDITIRIHSINKIVMGVTVNFHFDGKVVNYHGYDDSRLMEYIHNNNYAIPVEYNKLGEFFSGRKRQDKR